MALGKYSRIDGRKGSSNYCSTVTLVAFVALCLVGVWMMTSSSVVPLQNVDTSSEESKSEVRTVVSETNVASGSNGDSASSESNTSNDSNNDSVSNTSNDDSASNASNDNSASTGGSTESSTKTKQFEDNPGDLPEDATKGDANTGSTAEDNPSGSKENTDAEKESKSDTEGSPEEKPVKQSGEEDSSSQDAVADKGGNGEVKKEDGESKVQDKDSKSEETGASGDENNGGEQGNADESSNGNRPDSNESEKKSDESSEENKVENNGSSPEKEKEKKEDSQDKANASNELLPSGAQAELLNETSTNTNAWSTQAAESKNEKEGSKSSEVETKSGYSWKACNTTAGPDYIPCLDNLQAIRSLRTTKHYEHRERHCPEDPPTCLVPLPEGYQRSLEWPLSREKIWYHNVPHTKLAQVKGHQNWVKVTGEFLTFPGGGTQFKHGALHYIDFIQQMVPDIAWGKHSRVILDVGCGVASFGGFLFDRDVLTMSFAPKDEHEAQVQFALERGIPAISAVMGTLRLPYPARVFDAVHCARCRVPWHIEGGKLLLELNRLLRPGGYFLWSATPVYQKDPEDAEIWAEMKKLTKAMCWELISISKDRVNGVGIAVYRKPTSNECYEQRKQNEPPLCKESDDPNAAWNVPLQDCMHKVPVAASERGSQWPEPWPSRLEKPPYWLLSSQVGVYGKAAPEDFTADYDHWKRVVSKSYLNGLGINWSTVRNVMDMRAIYGGFAAALRDMNVWVMNIVTVDSPDTLPIIYERGLFGMYHDWCESFNTYPRSYDLLHADHLFSKIKKKCNLVALVTEVDRILRPEGKLIVRDNVETMNEVEGILKSMHWEVRLTYSKDKEGLLCMQKSIWRPSEVETLKYAIG